jgi:anti-anti-sigma factor
MPLDIQIQKSAPGEVPVSARVKLIGSLDTATSPELEKQLEPVLAGTATQIIFDLAGLKFITSAGLRVFASARKPLVARKGNVTFVNVQAQIQEVFNIIQALPGVSIFESLEEMDRYLAARQRAVNPNL